MADQWNITLGARYTYDTKGMTYITSSNAVGVPDNLITPACRSALQPGCSAYTADSAIANYSMPFDQNGNGKIDDDEGGQYGGQKAVVDGTIKAMPAFKGNNSVRSCEPPSGKIPTAFPSRKRCKTESKNLL